MGNWNDKSSWLSVFNCQSSGMAFVIPTRREATIKESVVCWWQKEEVPLRFASRNDKLEVSRAKS